MSCSRLFRDDSLRLWKAISTFIQEVISIHYKSDDGVVKDNELQAWVQDLHENGFPVREGDIDHEFPKSLATREQLVNMLTCVVFTCSCQHAAVNFGLMDVTAFVPNSPSVMRRSPPTKKNEATLKSIMETLPSKSQSARQIAAMYALTRFPSYEVSIKQSHYQSLDLSFVDVFIIRLIGLKIVFGHSPSNVVFRCSCKHTLF